MSLRTSSSSHRVERRLHQRYQGPPKLRSGTYAARSRVRIGGPRHGWSPVLRPPRVDSSQADMFRNVRSTDSTAEFDRNRPDLVSGTTVGALGRRRRPATPLPPIDRRMAATALEHNLTFVTRDRAALGEVARVRLFEPLRRLTPACSPARVPKYHLSERVMDSTVRPNRSAGSPATSLSRRIAPQSASGVGRHATRPNGCRASLIESPLAAGAADRKRRPAPSGIVSRGCGRSSARASVPSGRPRALRRSSGRRRRPGPGP